MIHSAADDLIAALARLGVEALVDHGRDLQHQADLVIAAPGGPIALDVTATAAKDTARVLHHVRTYAPEPDGDTPTVPFLVADQVSAEARQELRDAGWGYLDRRGHLALRAPGLLIDTDIDPVPRADAPTPKNDPINGRVGLSVAVTLLMNPGRRHSARALAELVDSSPSTANDAVRRLQEHALVGRDSLPLLPDLFWTTADAWKPERRYVARTPQDGGIPPVTFDRWALSGDVAASAHGALIVASSPRPLLYLPSAGEVRRVVRQLGPSDATEAEAALSVAPFSGLYVGAEHHPGYAPWRLVHPVIAALDLAQDRSRGREILDEWTPEDAIRVW